MKLLFTSFMIICSTIAYAQSVDNYKYVTVSNQYDFQNESNEFRLNELMVFLLKKHGFDAYRSSEVLPYDSNRGLCNTMQLKIEKSGSLWTDISASLVNCDGDILYTTPTARARQKNNEKAYFSAVREAFESFEFLDYSYSESSGYQDKKDSLSSSNNGNPSVGDQQFENVTAVSKDTVPTMTYRKAKFDFEDLTATEYALLFNDDRTGFELYQYGAVVGKGRKSGGGVFLVTADSFTGIGFMNEGEFIIEFDKDGISEKIILVE